MTILKDPKGFPYKTHELILEILRQENEIPKDKFGSDIHSVNTTITYYPFGIFKRRLSTPFVLWDLNWQRHDRIEFLASATQFEFESYTGSRDTEKVAIIHAGAYDRYADGNASEVDISEHGQVGLVKQLSRLATVISQVSHGKLAIAQSKTAGHYAKHFLSVTNTPDKTVALHRDRFKPHQLEKQGYTTKAKVFMRVTVAVSETAKQAHSLTSQKIAEARGRGEEEVEYGPEVASQLWVNTWDSNIDQAHGAAPAREAGLRALAGLDFERTDESVTSADAIQFVKTAVALLWKSSICINEINDGNATVKASELSSLHDKLDQARERKAQLQVYPLTPRPRLERPSPTP